MNRYFEEDKQATAEICRDPEPDKVVLAWASRKRHIFVNGVLLCEKKHKTGDGYNHKGGHYMSFQLEFPTWEKLTPDEKYNHSDGIIPAKPLDEIGGIIRSSICAACQKRYDKIFIDFKNLTENGHLSGH